MHFWDVARPERFELPTPGFVGRCSIQLSYGRVWTLVAELLSSIVALQHHDRRRDRQREPQHGERQAIDPRQPHGDEGDAPGQAQLARRDVGEDDFDDDGADRVPRQRRAIEGEGAADVVAQEQEAVDRLRRRERVMDGGERPGGRVALEHREVGHPDEGIHVTRHELHSLRHLLANPVQSRAGDVVRSGHVQPEVAVGQAEAVRRAFAEELGGGPVECAALAPDP